MQHTAVFKYTLLYHIYILYICKQQYVARNIITHIVSPCLYVQIRLYTKSTLHVVQTISHTSVVYKSKSFVLR